MHLLRVKHAITPLGALSAQIPTTPSPPPSRTVEYAGLVGAGSGGAT